MSKVKTTVNFEQNAFNLLVENLKIAKSNQSLLINVISEIRDYKPEQKTDLINRILEKQVEIESDIRSKIK